MFSQIARYFECLVDPVITVPNNPPPKKLSGFFYYFLMQTPGLMIRLFVGGLFVGVLDTAIPFCIGKTTELLGRTTPETLIPLGLSQLLAMAAIIFVVRPLFLLQQSLTINQAINPGMANMIRWQSHWHVVRQSLAFFQRDFAGRVAARVMQTAVSVRETLVLGVDAIWYIVVYGSSSTILLFSIDWRLGIPTVCWFVGYTTLLRVFIPRLRRSSRNVSRMRSNLNGRIVDTYSNMLTIKLFARAQDEDAAIKSAMVQHTDLYRVQTRMLTAWLAWLTLLNVSLLAGMAGISIRLWYLRSIPLSTVATALPLAWQLTNMAGWVGKSITSIFDNIGIVQDGMESISASQSMPDAHHAKPIKVSAGRIVFDDVSFSYGNQQNILHSVSFYVSQGERVGVAGASGAGKSTLVNLLLGFNRPQKGRILIDDQDIEFVTQESLRGVIAVVAQDTSLLHRSVLDNLRYGRPEASIIDVVSAARAAQAHDFIETLEDWNGGRGYDALVGERGVNLSGGQRQRIAIARALLKNSQIVILDEATSALDSETESAIQAQIECLMKGRTVIAIAHRLSTIACLDRILFLENGAIIEQGNHAELLALEGAYARAWSLQAGKDEI